MTSGFGEERKCGLRLLTETGRKLAAAGYLAMRIDFRGVGDGGGGQQRCEQQHTLREHTRVRVASAAR